MAYVQTSLAKKFLMAITGILMVLFVIAHLLGNLTIFFDSLNAYAAKLRSLPLLLWTYRSIMLPAVILHIVFGIRLTLENRAAKPQGYQARKPRNIILFAGETMIWIGLLLLAFIIYHLLHFTIRVTNPDISHFVDALGRPDVYKLVVLSFQRRLISLSYVFAMVVLFLHLSHGIQSVFQTMGWSNDRTLPVICKVGIVISGIIFFGYVFIPFTVISGFLRG